MTIDIRAVINSVNVPIMNDDGYDDDGGLSLKFLSKIFMKTK